MTDELITTDALARHLRRAPETVRRMARDGRIPSHGGGKGQDYRFSPVEVFEALIKEDVINTLNNIREDKALPDVIRRNLATMAEGVNAGWLSLDDVGTLMHAMEA